MDINIVSTGSTLSPVFSHKSVILDLNVGYIEHNKNFGLKLQIQLTLGSRIFHP